MDKNNDKFYYGVKPIDRLTSLFNKFPGIGPRQARRFVYFLLTENDAYIRELISLISKLKSEVSHCSSCFKLSLKHRDALCERCLDTERDSTSLMVVAKDIDLENITRSGEFNGKFFVLGGLLPILEKNPEQKIRIRELTMAIQKMIESQSGLNEVIIALSANSEGDNTTEYIRMMLGPICKENNIKLSVLGRGLSTGTELEYSDSDTIRNALKNRE